MRGSTIATFFGLALSQLAAQVAAKAVFAHYMIGTISEDNAHKDIDDAMAAGFDGFALNLNDPDATYAQTALNYLFGYADYRGFKLFLSIDLGGKAADPHKFDNLLKWTLGRTSYYRAGPNNYPMLSTFNDGQQLDTQWKQFLSTWGNQIYFVPDFDQTEGYYDAADGWWNYWGSIVDGLFSWESNWPVTGNTNGGDTSRDEKVMAGAKNHNKSYMMGLSLNQFKNAYDSNWYRKGDLNMVKRMEKILAMNPQPDFVEVITWNDGPESHYIGNYWDSLNGDAQARIYASQAGADHTGMLPLISSFIKAYKEGKQMLPPASDPIGALWHKTIFQDTQCPGVNSAVKYFQKPGGFETGSDSHNWAVVVPQGASGWKAELVSGGKVARTYDLKVGFNYGSSTDKVVEGTQRLNVRDGSGKLVAATDRGRCMSHSCVDGIYNMNFQVMGLKPAGKYDSRECWQVSGKASLDYSTNTVKGLTNLGPSN